MINYYEELDIDVSASIEEIQYQLIELEKIWRKREITRPDLAAKKLGLIYDAKKAFANPLQKDLYDQELKKYLNGSENSNSSLQQCEKWISNAKQYLQSNNYDLCEASLRKASSLKENDEQEAEINYLFALLYVSKVKNDIQIEINSSGTCSVQNLSLLERSYKYLNDALLINPNKIDYYELALEIYTIRYNVLVMLGNETEAVKSTTQKRSFLDYSIQRFSGVDKNSEIYLINQYAYSCLREKPHDIKGAEKAARKSMEMGDVTGEAQAILIECDKPKIVSIAELSSYLHLEKCDLWDDINNTIVSIRERYSNSNYIGKGWILAKTDKHHRTTDSNNQDTINNATFTYILTCQGQFIMVTSTYYEQEYGAPNAFHCDSESKKEILYLKDKPDFNNNFVSEFDFKVSLSIPLDKHLSYSCTSAWYWEKMDRFSERDSVIRRLTFTKGNGLLQAVSSILASNKEPEDISELISDDSKKLSPPYQQAENTPTSNNTNTFNSGSSRSNNLIGYSQSTNPGTNMLEQSSSIHRRSKSTTVLLLIVIAILLDIILFVQYIEAAKKGLPDSSFVIKGVILYTITYLLYLWYCYDRTYKSLVNNQKPKTVILSFVVWWVLSFTGIIIAYSSMRDSLVFMSVGLGLFTPILVFTGRYFMTRIAKRKAQEEK